MSVVNQMLLELDRRHAPAKDRHQLPPELRPLPPPPRVLPLSGPVVAGAIAVLLGGTLLAAWMVWRPPAPESTVVVLPTPEAEKIVLPAVAAPLRAPQPSAQRADVASAPAAEPPAGPAPVAANPPPTSATVAPAPASAVPTSPVSPAPSPPAAVNAQRAAPEPVVAPPARPAASLAAPVIEKSPPALTPRDRADDAYRRALENLELGRPAEAALALKQALREDPRHLPARLVLARLLVDQGESQGAADLLRASAAAGADDAEFHGLFAAVLQRLGRHEEARVQYEAALRLMPGNAVWWMGLGLSLESAGRGPEARTAFLRALSLGGLSPDLAGFVEQKARQLH